jgi:hypothetical protein
MEQLVGRPMSVKICKRLEALEHLLTKTSELELSSQNVSSAISVATKQEM